MAAIGTWLIATGLRSVENNRVGALDVEIVVLGERNAASGGHEVWLRPIGWTITVAEAAARADPPDGFKQVDGALLAASDQMASLRVKLPAAAAVELVRHPWSGMVRLSVNGTVQDIDLYADPALEPLRIPLAGSAAQEASWWGTIIAVSAGAAGALLLFFGIRQLLALIEVRGVIATGAVTFCILLPLLTAIRAPVFVTPDGIDYLAGATAIHRGDWAAAFTPLKAPLLSAISAGVLWFGPELRAVVWLHAAALLMSALIVWHLLRDQIGRKSAVAVASLFLIHPIVSTYQAYLLRESLGMLSVACLVWLTLRIDRDRRPILAGACLGACIGLGALLRENFVAMIALVPVMLCIAGFMATYSQDRWRRLRAALPALLVSLCLTLPYMAYNESRIGSFGITSPKTSFNALINAWDAGLVDDADDPARVQGSYRFVARLLAQHAVISAGDLAEQPVEAVVGAMLEQPKVVERLSAERLNSALATNAWAAAKARVATFFIQAGLWSTPSSRSNDFYSNPLRGHDISPTNYQVDLPATLSAPRFEHARAEIEEIVAVSMVRKEDFRFALPPPVFDALYGLYSVADWVLSAGFFVGLLVLARTRQTLLLGVGLIVVINWLGAAWLISQVDRFAVPFLPIKWVIGTVGVAAVAGWLLSMRQRPQPTGASTS